jgi:surface polysaccharide O-acyltransferase-like enzyme
LSGAATAPAGIVSQSDRAWYIDALKVVAIAAVAIIHIVGVKATGESDGGVGWWVANALYSGARWSVPVFVMASGALLLGRAGGPMSAFYRHRFSRVLPAAVFWTVAYLMFAALFQSGTRDPGQLVALIASGRPYNHLYFLPLIMGLYLVAPFLSRAIVPAPRGVVWGAAIVAISINVLDPLLGLLSGTASTPDLVTWWIPFVGYFILGYAIHTARPRVGRPLLAAVLIVAVFAQAVGLWWGIGHEPMLRGYLENYLCLPTVVAAVAVFAFLRASDDGSVLPHPLLARLSIATFGVYLCHLMIAVGLMHFGHLDASASVLALLAVWAVTIVLAFGVAAVAIRLPIARWVVGG